MLVEGEPEQHHDALHDKWRDDALHLDRRRLGTVFVGFTPVPASSAETEDR